ncbi:MAG: phenylalanine--tRNA ligase subunit beta [Candidatus Thermoplasmatota archaeon]|nr:phenylalanine--tRNA ligase subunit beta [Candidatus Thermoplasmatota archaeon]MCL5731277.1 phenylalanine--tRNA ligase subunit beta [Candidatus Thermoplasmatota archaeon]
MVTIRITRERLEKLYNKGSEDLIRAFSGVIGYTVDAGSDISVELNPDRLDLASYPTLISAALNFYGKKGQTDFFSPGSAVGKRPLINIDRESLKIRPFIYMFTAIGPPLGEIFDLLIDYQEKLHESVGKNRVLASIGIHDLDKITPPFHYSTVSEDFRITAYDGFIGSVADLIREHPKGIEYGSLVKGVRFPAIFDSDGKLLSIPPIINGIDSRLSETSQNILVDLTGTEFTASASAFYLLLNFFMATGYTVSIPKMDGRNFTSLIEFGSRSISVSLAAVRSYLGDLHPADIRNALSRMGYITTISGNRLEVKTPSQRNDVMGEVDVIEDIAKGIGYSKIPAKRLILATTGKGADVMDASRTLKYISVAMGYQEVMSFFITSPRLFRGNRDLSGYHVVNPKSIDSSIIRSSIYPSLLWNFSNNRRRPTPQKIFEIGSVVVQKVQRQHICLGEFGSRANFNDARSALDSLLYRITGYRPELVKSDNSDLIPGRSGDIYLAERMVGVMGEVSPEVLTEFNLTLPVAVIEIDLDSLPYQR